jgi:glycosyltransferase involved in cell wall biosynthesis
MTVVESLAAGVPAVVTRTCPWSEIEQRQCGLWVEQHAAAIANALRRLADDPWHAARWGRVRPRSLGNATAGMRLRR